MSSSTYVTLFVQLDAILDTLAYKNEEEPVKFLEWLRHSAVLVGTDQYGWTQSRPHPHPLVSVGEKGLQSTSLNVGPQHIMVNKIKSFREVREKHYDMSPPSTDS